MKPNFYFPLLSLFLGFHIICSAQPSSKDFEIHKLADGVYAATYKQGGRAISNSGFVDLGDGTLVFDSFISPYAAEELKRVIAALGLSPVKYVVNSHFHDDHIRGNQVFTGAAIYSTQKTKDLIAETEPAEFTDEKESLPGLIAQSDSLLTTISPKDSVRKVHLQFWNNYYKTILEAHKIYHNVLPNKMVNGKVTLKGSKQTVELIDMGMGHTSSDLILSIPKLKIIFTGDLLFVQNHTWIADGDLDSLKNDLTKIKAMNPVTLVPGHGPVAHKNDIDTMLHYLDQINTVAQEQIKKGLRPDQVRLLPIPAAYQSWLLDNFYTPNVKFQMKQLLTQADRSQK